MQTADQTTPIRALPLPGERVRGTVAKITTMGYCWVELRDDPSMKFISPTDRYPGLREGAKVLFELNAEGTVSAMGRDREPEATRGLSGPSL